jgi:hypothetical protein
MKCISSPALDDLEIIKYVEGEADDAVVAHIQECPFCREKASRWAHLQNRLQKEVYRAACPTPIELGDYHLELLPDPQKLVIAQHLRECPLCRREVAELEEFMLEPTAQTSWLAPVKVLIARLLSGKEVDQAQEKFSPAFAGLRGEGDEPFIYQADQTQIVIEVQEDLEQPGLKVLMGLVSELESNEFIVQASQKGKVRAVSPIDEIGNFVLVHVAPGEYELTVRGPNTEIRIQSFTVT